MKTNPINKGIIAKNFSGIGAVTQDMINVRAHELARLSGRMPAMATRSEVEQARRELTGGSDQDRQDEIIESIPESERWDPVPGSPGLQVPEQPSEDEDDEGRNESAQLVEEGVQEAEHDQMLQAEIEAEDAEKRDRQGR